MVEMIATREAYGKMLVELGRENPNIVALDADLSKSTMSVHFAKEFPDRFFNMGIAEANMISTAAGLATAGKIPFASTFAVFATGRVWDQVRMGACYSNQNVKIVGSHGGITVGEDGASHQALEDIALMRVLPRMTVIVPADAVETRKAVKAMVDYVGPVYLRTGRAKVPVIYEKDYNFEIGKAVVLREGKDVGIIACGIMVSMALDAAKMLADKNIQARVVNIHTIKPLDEKVITETAKMCGKIVTAEEHSILGGLGGAVAEVVSETFPVPIKRIGIHDTFGESGTPDALLKKYGLTAENIAFTCEKIVNQK